MSMDYIPGKSFFHKLNPLTKFLYCAVITIPTMVSTDPIVLSVTFLSIVMVFFFAKIPLQRLTSLLKLIIPSTILYILISLAVLEVRPDYLFFFYLIPPLKWIPVTLEGLSYSAGIVLKFVIVVVSFRLVLLVTPITDLVRGISKLRVPPSIVMAISTALSSLPVIASEARAVQEAQWSRGLRTDYPDPIRKAKAFMKLLVPLLTLSITRSMRLAVAIESRGFGQMAKARTYLRELRFSRADYAVVVLLVVVGFLFLYLGSWWTNQIDYTLTVNLIKRLLSS
jgi:energy-coupling factor transport system permease protein